MFGIENWDGDFEGLMAFFTCIGVLICMAWLGWTDRNNGTWNDVFKMYGLVMASVLIFILISLIIGEWSVIILIIWWLWGMSFTNPPQKQDN